MPLFFAEEIQKQIYYKNKKININKIKEICINLCYKNNINYIPIKIIYLIIYLEKNNYKFKLINKIFNKSLKRSYKILSKFLYKIIQYKWLNIVKISINNNVEDELIKYFLNLYELYINEENINDIYKYQLYFIFNHKVGYYRQFCKFMRDNIYKTYFFIPIIFSKISKSNLILNNIFVID